jgi:hypothetical protein
VKHLIDVLALVAFIAVAGLFVQLKEQQRRDDAAHAHVASCASLYAMARTSEDSLFIAMNRGDCVRVL